MMNANVFKPGGARAARSRGFTLIEILVVVAVIGVLSAIAYPSYMDSVRKGRRAEARAALMAEMQQQERYFTQMNTYRSPPFKTYSGESSDGSKYAVSAGACDGMTGFKDCIKLTATPNAGFADTEVGNIWLDSAGNKSCTGTDTARCWK
jgi:type IV pilus assembly protein PilE